jgi:hypothetical protein
MKKILLFLIVLLVALGCKSIRLKFNDKNIKVKSRIKENSSLIDNSFRQSKGGIYVKLSSVEIKFKDKPLQRNNFIISVFDTDVGISSSFLENFNSNVELSSFNSDEYAVKVYKVTSDMPIFKKFDKNFNYILISKKQAGFVIVLENYSNFNDNVSEKFLMEKLKELNFTQL